MIKYFGTLLLSLTMASQAHALATLSPLGWVRADYVDCAPDRSCGIVAPSGKSLTIHSLPSSGHKMAEIRAGEAVAGPYDTAFAEGHKWYFIFTPWDCKLERAEDDNGTLYCAK
jgi:hypothetical protein